MTNITIRKATDADAAGIANVHINSWREAYRGILTPEYLDSLPLEFNDRYELWTQVIALSAQPLFVAVHTNHGIIGFAGGGDARDKKFEGYAEVYAIYLLIQHQGKGIGLGLLKSLFVEFSTMGASRVYSWVLQDNPAVHFYKKSGAIDNGETREDIIGGRKVKSLCLEWPNLIL